MTLFTAEALLRAHNRWRDRGIVDTTEVARRAYLRWLETQDGWAPDPDSAARSGWLLSVPELHARRAPGNTCLAALRSGGRGAPDRPVNDSKGCGGLMRVAPIGFVWKGHTAFRKGCEWAAITHGWVYHVYRIIVVASFDRHPLFGVRRYPRRLICLDCGPFTVAWELTRSTPRSKLPPGIPYPEELQ